MGVAFSLSVIAKGQTATTPAEPAKTTLSEDDMEDTTASAACSEKCCRNNDNKFVVYSDFGGSTIYNNFNGTTTSAPGLTWAVSGQLAHQFKTKCHGTRLFLSFGLELRNFNGTLSTPDGLGSTAYDNYHYWYAGIPVTFQVVTVKHNIGHLTDFGFYAQAGMSLGFKVDMLDVSSIQGQNSWNDVNDHYTAVMLHQYASAGLAIKTTNATYLIGPYAGYVFSNMSKDDGVTENVFSYGARFSVLLFK